MTQLKKCEGRQTFSFSLDFPELSGRFPGFSRFLLCVCLNNGLHVSPSSEIRVCAYRHRMKPQSLHTLCKKEIDDIFACSKFVKMVALVTRCLKSNSGRGAL